MSDAGLNLESKSGGAGSKGLSTGHGPGSKGGGKLSHKERPKDLAEQMRRSDLRAAGGTYSQDEVAQLLGLAEEVLCAKVNDDELLAIPVKELGLRFPVAQFMGGRVPNGFSDVLKAFSDKSPWARLRWLIHPDTALNGRTPLEVLKFCDENGQDPEIVVVAARSLGHMGI